MKQVGSSVRWWLLGVLPWLPVAFLAVALVGRAAVGRWEMERVLLLAQLEHESLIVRRTADLGSQLSMVWRHAMRSAGWRPTAWAPASDPTSRAVGSGAVVSLPAAPRAPDQAAAGTGGRVAGVGGRSPVAEPAERLQRVLAAVGLADSVIFCYDRGDRRWLAPDIPEPGLARALLRLAARDFEYFNARLPDCHSPFGPIHTPSLERVRELHRFTRMCLPHRELWLCPTMLDAAGRQQFVMVMLAVDRLDRVALDRTWLELVGRRLRHSLVVVPDDTWNGLRSHLREGQHRGGRFAARLGSGVVLAWPDQGRRLVLYAAFSSYGGTWLVLGLSVVGALSFAWLVGSWRAVVGGDNAWRDRLGRQTGLRLGLAVLVPGFGLLVIGEMLGNTGRINHFADLQSENLARLKEGEDELLRFRAGVERAVNHYLRRQLPPTTPAQAWELSVNRLTGRFELAHALVFSAEGQPLVPHLNQYRAMFVRFARGTTAQRRWFADQAVRRGWGFEDFYRRLFARTPANGLALSRAEILAHFRGPNRLSPQDEEQVKLLQALGGLARKACATLNQARGLPVPPAESQGPDLAEVMAAVAGVDADELLGNVLNGEGRLRTFSTSMETHMDMPFFFRDRSGRVVSMAVLHWRGVNLLLPRSLQLVRAAVARPGGGALFLVCNEIEALDLGSERLPPGGRELVADLDRVRECRVFVAPHPIRGWQVYTFHRGRSLQFLVFGAAHPLAALDAGHRRFAAGFFVALVVAVAWFWLGGQAFIAALVRPIGDLELVAAELGHDRPLPPVRQPVGELEQLSALFTQVHHSLQELNLARAVQEELLPREAGHFGALRVQGRSVMMEQVGGDFFDYLRDPLDPDRLYVCIGDVTGHGLAAAVVVAMVSGGLRLLVARPAITLEQCLTRLNAQLFRILKRLRLVTMQLVRIDTRNGAFGFISAGHPPLLQAAPGQACRVWEMRNFPVGSRGLLPQSASVGRLAPGEVLVFSSDGFIEAELPDGQVLGYGGFERLIARNVALGQVGLLERIFTDFAAVTAGVPWADDATVVVVAMTPPGSR